MDKNTMQAVVYDDYGSANQLTVRELPIPAPKAGEVLVRVISAGVNPIDTYFRQGRYKWMFMNKPPHFVGKDFAGIIEKIGLDLSFSGLEVGQPVFGSVRSAEGGSYAEYAIAKISDLAVIPENVSFEEAAALPVAALTALQSIRNLAHLSPHQTVLINGGAGGVGLFAIQLAKLMNTTVFTTCGPENIQLCKQYGADEVINYKQTELKTLDRKFDLFFDTVGSESFTSIRGLLNDHGKYITTLPDASTLLDLARTTLMKQKAFAILCRINTADLDYIAKLVAENKLKVLISNTFSLEQTVQAHEQIESHHTHGKIVLQIAEAESTGETANYQQAATLVQ